MEGGARVEKKELGLKLSDCTNVVATTSKGKDQQKIVKRYTVKDGWIHCRAIVKVGKPASKRASTCAASPKQPPPKVQHSENYKAATRHLYHKDERFPCPDCASWYGDDKRKLQLSCRHKRKTETDEDLKAWDIDFPDESQQN